MWLPPLRVIKEFDVKTDKRLRSEVYIRELERQGFCLVPTRIPWSRLIRVRVAREPGAKLEAGPLAWGYGRNVLLAAQVLRRHWSLGEYANRADPYEAPLWALNNVALKRERVIEGAVTADDMQEFVAAAKWLQKSDLGSHLFRSTDGPLWPQTGRESVQTLNVVHRDFHRLHPGRYIPAMRPTGVYGLMGFLAADWATFDLRYQVEDYVRSQGLLVLPNACGVPDVEFYKRYDFVSDLDL